MKKFLLLAALFAGGFARAQDGNALLDALVRKKILTPQEAKDIQADLVKEESAASTKAADKIKLGASLTELSLYGDIRLRYQYDHLDPQVRTAANPNPDVDRSRWRFRLRLNADFKLTDNWFGGVQLQTNNQSDSGFQTYTGGFRNYDIFVSRAFIGWNAADWFTIVAGKQPNPFYTTELLWDADINPAGIVEQIRFHKLFGADVREEAAGYSRDGKRMVSLKSQTIASPWELTLIAGQLFFADNSDIHLPSAYLFEEQLLFSYRFSNGVKFTIAPAYLTYNPAKVTNALNSQPFTRETDNLPDSVHETSDLSLIQVPGDVAFKIAGREVKILWDAVYNTAGNKRTRDVYGVADHSSRDDLAFLAGFQIGENRKKGDWSLFGNYREIGFASIDPNLNDSDWGLSRLNLRGFKGGFAYNFTDAVLAAFSFSAAWNIRQDLVGGQATGNARLADANAVQVLQVDFNVKF